MRLLKRILIGVLLTLVLAAAGVCVRFYVLWPVVRPAPGVHAPRTAEAVARGRYLAGAVMGCTACHSPVEEGKPGEPPVESRLGAGRDFGPLPGFFPGRIRAGNLTPDPETGLGGWSDGEILRAIRDGVDRKGRPLFPIMPYPTFARVLNDEDALDVIAYLRSLKPIHNDPGPMVVDFPASMFARAVPRPVGSVTTPEPATPLERGRWLLESGHCNDCHTPVDAHHQPLPGLFLAGGTAFPVPGRGLVYARNITSDRETGLGGWTTQEIATALFAGMGRDGRPLYGMPWPYYAELTADDQRDLILALRAVPPVRHSVAKDGPVASSAGPPPATP